jgi:Calcineurin-like phosphoesterase
MGGTTTLIQLGDATDRGPDSRGVLSLLRRLSSEAKAQGGEVITLLGNHEVMNMQGDWRYVSPGDVATYGGQEARIEAFLPGGEEGAWLRTLPAVVQRGDTVFVHAGITPRWAALGLDELNRQLREAIERPGSPILGPDSPLWFRGFVEDDSGATCADLRASLQLLGARRMVVGHTRTKNNRVQARCQGALLAADVSLSGVYQGGHLGALELRNGDARALYPEGPEDLPEPE